MPKSKCRGQLAQEMQSLRLRLLRSRGYLKRALRRQCMHLLQHVYRPGALPDFLIVGAMKCGTSTLFHMLSQHPGVMPPVTKEIHFLNNPDHYRRGERWYRAHFPTQTALQDRTRQLGYRALTGEATPAMSSPVYAENAARLVPDARLVVTLRNPVHRAYSHYQHMVHHLRPERLGFEAALDREQALLDTGAVITPANYRELAPLLLNRGYLNRGRYALELEQWFRFFPREQFLFLNFDTWKTHPEQAAAQVARHIGLPEHPFQQRHANAGSYRAPLPKSCQRRLTEYYRPWNRRLFELLGEDWGWPC